MVNSAQNTFSKTALLQIALRVLPLIFVLNAGFSFMEQQLTDQLEVLMAAESIGFFVTAISLSLISLAAPLLYYFIFLAQVADQTGLKIPLQERLKYLTIENLRATGNALLWSFLLIIPGLWRFIQYSFVPYLVLLSSKYQQGQLDALKASQKLSHKSKFILLFYWFCFLLSSAVFASMAAPFEEFSLNPFSALAVSLIDSLILFAFMIWFFFIFNKAYSKLSLTEGGL